MRAVANAVQNSERVHGMSVVDGLETRRSAEVHERARRFLPKGVTGDGRWSQPVPDRVRARATAST